MEAASAKQKEKKVALEMRAAKRKGEGSTACVEPVTKLRPLGMTTPFNPYQQVVYPYQHMFCPPFFQYPMPSFLIHKTSAGTSNATAFYNYNPQQ